MGLDIKTENDYAPYFVIEAFVLPNIIEEITKPIKLSQEETKAIFAALAAEPKKDWEVKGIVAAWLIYIAVLIGSLIFKEFYFIWIVATYIFLKYRKEMLN